MDQGFVLIVDDNEMNRDLLSRRLQRQGHRSMTAENGREALEKIKVHDFDLVLLDIMMPEMNGFEVLEFLKADEELRHLPVIVVSAAEDMESVIKGIKLGAEDYLSKPYNSLLLKARIGACLDKKRLRDQERAHMAEMAVMQQIDRELNATLDVERAMEITLAWALRQTGDQAGLMGVIDDDRINVIAASGYTYELDADHNMLLIDELPAAQAALQSQQLQYLADTGGRGLLVRAQSQLAVPIRREEKSIALLLLENNQSKTWTSSKTNFLTRLSDHAAMAIANAQMYEAVQAANLAKTEFVSFVSHELKIPMTSIRGYADLLLMGAMGQANEAQTKLLKTIRSNVDRMNRLVSDLSDVSRIEAGHLHLETSAVSIEEVIEDVMESTQGQIEEKKQTITVDVPDDLPLVWGDRTRLVQILTNLISNAYKYTPQEGKITVRAEMTDYQNEDEIQPMVHVLVQDTGLGIKEEEQKKIFNKFARADDSEALKSPGTGLGLNITKSLVEMHQGHIWFESTYRQGTTFHFVVPVAEA